MSLSDDEASGSVERGGVCWKTAQPAPRTLPLDCPLRGGKGGEGACGSRVDEIVPAVTLPLKPGDLALRLTGGG